MLTSFYGNLRTANGKASSLGEYETTAGDYRVLFDAPDEIHKITARDLQAVAERYLQTSGRTVIIAEPDESQDDSDEDEDDGQDGPLSGVLH